MKKTFLVKILILLFLFSGTMNVLAAEYTLLEPSIFGGGMTSVGDESSFISYLQLIFKTLLTASIILAVLMIVIGGFEYITSASGLGKTEGKNKIWEALKGLAIILLSWLILNTINPELINWTFSITPL